jgi:hypothetical protein
VRNPGLDLRLGDIRLEVYSWSVNCDHLTNKHNSTLHYLSKMKLLAAVSVMGLAPQVVGFAPQSISRPTTQLRSSGMDMSGNTWKPDSEKMGVCSHRIDDTYKSSQFVSDFLLRP